MLTGYSVESLFASMFFAVLTSIRKEIFQIEAHLVYRCLHLNFSCLLFMIALGM